MDEDQNFAEEIIAIARRFNVGTGEMLMNSVLCGQLKIRDQRERGVAFALQHDWISQNGSDFTINAKGLAGIL